MLSCPYTDFPVVPIREHEARVVPTSGVSGPSGIVASGDEVALIGTYRDPSLFIRGIIRDDAFLEAERAHLWAPDGTPLPMAQAHCRGPVVHFMAGRDWFRFDLANDS